MLQTVLLGCLIVMSFSCHAAVDGLGELIQESSNEQAATYARIKQSLGEPTTPGRPRKKTIYVAEKDFKIQLRPQKKPTRLASLNKK